MGHLFAILAGVGAGASIATAKMGLINISAITFGFYATLSATLFSLLYLVTTRQLHLATVPKRAIMPFSLHIAGSFFFIWTFWEGIKLLNASVASFLSQGEIVFVLLFSRIFLKEKLKRADIIATLIILSGIAIVAETNPTALLTSLTSEHRGIGFILASALCFGITELFSKKIAMEMSPFALVLIRNLVLAVVFGLIAYMRGVLTWPSASTIVVIALSALFGQTLARLSFMQALRTLDLGKAALLSRIEPFVVALLSWILFRELPTPSQWLGGLLILAGCGVIYAGHRMQSAIAATHSPQATD